MIIFLYGQDTFRSREKLKELKDKFSRDIDKTMSSLDVLEGGNITMEKINEAVAAPSLFAKRRMVVLENIFLNKNKDLFTALETYLKKKSSKQREDDTIIVFWQETGSEKLKTNSLFKYLSKEKHVQEFKPLNNSETISWIKKEGKKRSGDIKHQAAIELAGFFGNDLWQLSNEINKLINYKLGKKPGLIKDGQTVEIGPEDIKEMVRGTADENIFALTDAIATKNKSKALELFENEISAGVTEGYLIAMILRQFKILIQVSDAISKGMSARKIQNEFKLHPYVVQKSSAQAKNFTLTTLKSLYAETIDIDYQLKTDQTDAKTALTLMITKI